MNELIEKLQLIELPYRLQYCEECDVIQEAEWIIEDYEDDGHPLHDELKHAKWLLKRTEDGKRIPISCETFRPLDGFSQQDIENARAVIRDYKNTKIFLREVKREQKRIRSEVQA